MAGSRLELWELEAGSWKLGAAGSFGRRSDVMGEIDPTGRDQTSQVRQNFERPCWQHHYPCIEAR